MRDIGGVEVVAMWIGVVSGIAGVVLAVVSITFAYVVERNATKINNQMIQSLQKIESAVERTTGDTSDLIKVAWDRMLPTASNGGDNREHTRIDDANDDIAQSIASGVAAELRAELANLSTVDDERLTQFNRAIENLQRSVETQIGSAASSRYRDPVLSLRGRLTSLSPAATALIAEIAGGSHLTRAQYQRLQELPETGRALRELRMRSLLVPLEGRGRQGQPIPVYWLEPGTSSMVAPMLRLTPQPPPRITRRVQAALQSVGYRLANDDAISNAVEADRSEVDRQEETPDQENSRPGNSDNGTTDG
ncbi:hypothetical protein [Nocardia farcinica]|uniref:hypothetical protein n=1 Tax=Nocardia farcinica TaxID=37329 RepID=UPI00245888E6|nr:hypothetical protein [Nocardia farcinica]